MPMLITSLSEMQVRSEVLRREGRRIGFVPTMGALHEGHLHLVRTARQHADVVVVSIFVNPTQFAPHEDYSAYPRDLERDMELARGAGCDLLFQPQAEDMYPAGFDTLVDIPSLTGLLEGEIRPTHFRGVLTVVLKLFHLVKPHVAIFGQKDAQQALILQRMVRDLNMDLDMIIAPIVRESDGLAMSSRNAYLSDRQRTDALVLSRALRRVEAAASRGERDVAVLRSLVHDTFAEVPDVELQYAAFVDTTTLLPQTWRAPHRPLLLALAARVGPTRLIDNTLIPPPETSA